MSEQDMWHPKYKKDASGVDCESSPRPFALCRPKIPFQGKSNTKNYRLNIVGAEIYFCDLLRSFCDIPRLVVVNENTFTQIVICFLSFFCHTLALARLLHTFRCSAESVKGSLSSPHLKLK